MLINDCDTIVSLISAHPVVIASAVLAAVRIAHSRRSAADWTVKSEYKVSIGMCTYCICKLMLGGEFLKC